MREERTDEGRGGPPSREKNGAHERSKKDRQEATLREAMHNGQSDWQRTGNGTGNGTENGGRSSGTGTAAALAIRLANATGLAMRRAGKCATGECENGNGTDNGTGSTGNGTGNGRGSRPGNATEGPGNGTTETRLKRRGCVESCKREEEGDEKRR